MPSQHTVRTVTLIATAAAALLLAACGRDDNKTVGQKIDAAIASADPHKYNRNLRKSYSPKRLTSFSRCDSRLRAQVSMVRW